MNQTPTRKSKARWFILAGLALALVFTAATIGDNILSKKQNYEAALNNAEHESRGGNYAVAVAYAKRALEIEPHSERALYQSAFDRAEQALSAENYPVAVEYFNRALEIRPRSVRAHLDAGLSLESQYVPGAQSDSNSDQVNRAIRHYETVLTLPDEVFETTRTIRTHRDAVYRLGQVAYKRKEYEQALALFGKAIEADPKYKWAWCYRGFAAVRLAEGVVFKFVQDSEPGRNILLGLADTRIPRDRLPPGALNTLRSKVDQTINSAITDCQRAVDIGGPSFPDPMMGLCGAYVLRAGLQERKEAYAEDMALWRRWREKWAIAGGPTETGEKR